MPRLARKIAGSWESPINPPLLAHFLYQEWLMIKQRLPVGCKLSVFARVALAGLIPFASFGVAVFADRHRFAVTDHASSITASKSEAETRAKEAAVEKLRISCRFQEQLPPGISVDLADYTLERTSCDQKAQNGTILYSCTAELKGFCEWSDSNVNPTPNIVPKPSEVKEQVEEAQSSLKRTAPSKQSGESEQDRQGNVSLQPLSTSAPNRPAAGGLQHSSPVGAHHNSLAGTTFRVHWAHGTKGTSDGRITVGGGRLIFQSDADPRESFDVPLANLERAYATGYSTLSRGTLPAVSIDFRQKVNHHGEYLFTMLDDSSPGAEADNLVSALQSGH